MSHKPTAEQTAVIDGFTAGQSLVVVAVAGAGKTTTLRMAAEARLGRRMTYIAYNKPLQVEAKRTMPRNVDSRTSHSLAFREVGRAYAHRLDSPRMPSREAAKIMYADGRIGVTRVLNGPIDVGGPRPLQPSTLARLALETVERWSYSADDAIEGRHVPQVPGVTHFARQALVDVLVPIAELAWKDLSHPGGKLKFKPDHYLKIWALGHPRIPSDVILFDEAQDANGCLSALLKEQDHAQLIAVGDPCQQLYAWRGSIDALTDWPADRRLALSQSFRFGRRIADRANAWLDLLAAETRVIGAPWLDSTVGLVDQPDAVLCRSNAGAMHEVIDRLDAGARVHLVGGGDAIRRLAEAADKLMHGEPCDHPDLVAFSTWDDVRQYVAEDDASDLAPLVKLIDEHTPAAIVAATQALTADSAEADVVVSTGHKAKGLQWPRVRIGSDFKEPMPRPWPKPDSRPRLVLRKGELMLGYVAVTRAENELDDSEVRWVDRVHDWHVPIVVVGEDGAAGEPARPVAKIHPPEAILPDRPVHADELEPDALDELTVEARRFLERELPGVEPESGGVPDHLDQDNEVDHVEAEYWASHCGCCDSSPCQCGDLVDEAVPQAPPGYADLVAPAATGGWISLYCIGCLKRHRQCTCPPGMAVRPIVSQPSHLDWVARRVERAQRAAALGVAV